MGNELSKAVKASELASALGLKYEGNDHSFDRICAINNAGNGVLCFTKETFQRPRDDAAVVIAPAGTAVDSGTIIVAKNPRLTFAKALNWLNTNLGFLKHQHEAKIHAKAIVSNLASVGRGVKIGKGTVIGHFVVIADGVQIGDNCIIKSNTVIGEDGFGFERDDNGIPIRLIHLGSVVIGDNVEIGSLNTICRGTLSDTIIESDVKTDDHVHIAHNCHIRRGSLLTACVELSGGVDIGEYVWIGPNSSVIQKISIGNHAFVGIASNVTKPVPSGVTVAGNPAKVLPKRES